MFCADSRISLLFLNLLWFLRISFSLQLMRGRGVSTVSFGYRKSKPSVSIGMLYRRAKFCDAPVVKACMKCPRAFQLGSHPLPSPPPLVYDAWLDNF